MRYLILALICFVISSCTDKEGKPTGVIPEHQKQTLEKAKETEALLKQKEEEVERKLEEATQ